MITDTHIRPSRSSRTVRRKHRLRSHECQCRANFQHRQGIHRLASHCGSQYRIPENSLGTYTTLQLVVCADGSLIMARETLPPSPLARAAWTDAKDSDTRGPRALHRHTAQTRRTQKLPQGATPFSRAPPAPFPGLTGDTAGAPPLPRRYSGPRCSFTIRASW